MLCLVVSTLSPEYLFGINPFKNHGKIGGFAGEREPPAYFVELMNNLL